MSDGHPFRRLLEKFRSNTDNSSQRDNKNASDTPKINHETKPGNRGQSSSVVNPEPSRNTTGDALTGMQSNVFDTPIASSQPSFPTRAHTLQPKSIPTASTSGQPISTNKFYSNLYLESQKDQIYPLPYVLKWSGKGLDIDHSDESQRVFGPSGSNPAQYFFSPVGNVSLSLTATENPVQLAISDPGQFSVGLTFSPADRSGTLSTTIVRGSACIAARYQSLTPQIESGILFRSLQPSTVTNGKKWRVILEDGKVWLIYASAGSQDLNLTLTSNTTLKASARWTGLIQVSKLPGNDTNAELLFDKSVGSYTTAIILSGAVGSDAQYRFDFQKMGNQPVLMYALPHHVNSFSSTTKASIVGYKLASPTTGQMSLVSADYWTLASPLPNASQLSPVPSVSSNALSYVRAALTTDANQDFDSQIRVDSMYYSGKALNKLAQLTLLAKGIQDSTYQTLLPILDRNVLFFVRNQQQYPLAYENTWGGIVSIQGFTDRGNGSDFGNTWYNDHHYHYGYHVSTVAIWLNLFPSSTARAEVQAWATSLVRDVATPRYDQWFPAYRAMDWFVGHSWSKGLYESGDGKDEESSSEDYHFTYAAYLFGVAINDAALRDRSLIQLAVQKQSMNSYMLYTPGNQIEPSQFVPNWVSGIKFENKIDHTTYFGQQEEYIHGIHILPVTPITPFIRPSAFVRNEWDAKLKGLIQSSPQMDEAWKSLLYASLGASVEGYGGEAWKYFTNSTPRVDAGATRSWYLAMISAQNVGSLQATLG